MKHLKKLSLKAFLATALITITLLPTFQAQAQTYPQCNAGSCRGLVGRVLFDASGQLFIAVTGANIGALTSCDATNGLARVPASNPNQKSIYALALTAFATQEPVQVAIVPSSPTCDVSFMSLFN